MEDQQPDPGDLSTDAAPAARRRHRMPTGKKRAAATGTEPADEPANADEPADEPATDDDAEIGTGTDDVVKPEPRVVPFRQAGKWLKIAAVAAAALFVASGAFAGAAVQPYLSDRALVDTKLDIARTATSAINTLWTYTPDDMAALPDRASQYLSGQFATEYRRYIDAIVSTNKQAEVTNNTEVMGTAVESVTPNEATALVYTNSVSTSPVTKNIPSLRYLSYRLTMERADTRWLITRMTAITSLDLTPRL